MGRAISINDVSLFYDGEAAVERATFDVQGGEFFGLIGLNGAGKTTLIKAMLDLKTCDNGQISLFDRPARDKDVRKNLAFLPERFEPSWFLSGLEFLKFSGALYKKTLSDAQCKEAAERLALNPDALKRRVQTYSKGMRQKLGLIATVLTGCNLLILDEPMSGLDPQARALVKNYLKDVRSRGATIFLSSHILADMEEICGRVAVLYNKRILFTGPPAVFRSQHNASNLEQAFLHFIENHQ